MTESFPLLRTKLYRPCTQADLVPHLQLVERLDGRQRRPPKSLAARLAEQAALIGW